MKHKSIVKVIPVSIEPDYENDYPPTVHGITWAVRQWQPIVQYGELTRIFHDAQVEEGQNFTCHITALIEPAVLEELMRNEVEGFTNEEAIAKELAGYLERWRPVCVLFDVRVLAIPNPLRKWRPYR